MTSGSKSERRRDLPWLSELARHGHNAVTLAIEALGNWITAKIKIRVPRIAARPAAGAGGERVDLLGGGET